MTLENFRAVNLKIDRANGSFLSDQFAKEGDYNGRRLVVQLSNAGVVGDLTGVVVNLGWRHYPEKNTGLDPFEPVDLSQGIFEIYYPKEMLNEGIVTAVIQIIEGDHVTETKNFKINVEKSVIDEDTIVSENSFTVLQDALLTVNRYDSRIANVENSKVDTSTFEQSTNNLTAQLQQTDQQLAQDIKYSTTNFNLLTDNKKERRTIVSFIADDAPKSDLTKLLPIMQEKNIPVGLGVITNNVGKTVDMGNGPVDYMTWDDLKYMEQNGAEIMGHTHTHPNLTTLTPEEILTEVRLNKNVLARNGYLADGFVYPFNANSANTAKEVMKEFKYAFTARTFNTPTMSNKSINRYNLGAYYDAASYSEYGNPTSSLEYYKERVDYAVENDEWLVFVLHSHHNYLNATQQQHLRDTIDYIRSQGIEIVSPREGFEIYGNIIELGNDVDGIRVDGSGIITGLKVNIEDYDVRVSTEQIQSYPKNSVAITPISPEHAAADGGFGSKNRGVLVTHYVGYRNHYQEYVDSSAASPTVYTTNTYRRRALDSNNWTPWENLNTVIVDEISTSGNAGILDRPITSFPIGKVTITAINGNQASNTNENFPQKNGGVLTTCYLSTYSGHRYQKYEAVVMGTTPIKTTYTRYYQNTGWTNWVKDFTTSVI